MFVYVSALCLFSCLVTCLGFHVFPIVLFLGERLQNREYICHGRQLLSGIIIVKGIAKEVHRDGLL